jgi:2-methylcitrate dehydratase PrpD
MPSINVQHLIAMLLIDRMLSFGSIHDETRLGDSRILALRQHITLLPSEELAQARPRRQAIVSVRMKDGRLLSKRTHAVRGTPDNPMTQAEVEEKASGLIVPIIGTARARAMLRAIARLETMPDVTVLRRLWQPPKIREPIA